VLGIFSFIILDG